MWRGRPAFTGQCTYELLLAYRLVILYGRVEKKNLHKHYFRILYCKNSLYIQSGRLPSSSGCSSSITFFFFFDEGTAAEKYNKTLTHSSTRRLQPHDQEKKRQTIRTTIHYKKTQTVLNGPRRAKSKRPMTRCGNAAAEEPGCFGSAC